MEMQRNKAGLTRYVCCFTKPTSRRCSHHHPDLITSAHGNKSKHFRTNICHVLLRAPIYTLRMFSPRVTPAIPFCCLGASESKKPLSVCCLFTCKTTETAKLPQPLDMPIIMQTESACNSTTSAQWKELAPRARHGVGDEQRKFTEVRCVVGNEGKAMPENMYVLNMWEATQSMSNIVWKNIRMT